MNEEVSQELIDASGEAAGSATELAADSGEETLRPSEASSVKKGVTSSY